MNVTINIDSQDPKFGLLMNLLGGNDNAGVSCRCDSNNEGHTGSANSKDSGAAIEKPKREGPNKGRTNAQKEKARKEPLEEPKQPEVKEADPEPVKTETAPEITLDSLTIGMRAIITSNPTDASVKQQVADFLKPYGNIKKVPKEDYPKVQAFIESMGK